MDSLEEAWSLPELASTHTRGAPSYSVGGLGAKLSASLIDLHGRTQEMDKRGIEHMVMSLTSPGPQGEVDQAKAEALAERANNVSHDS